MLVGFITNFFIGFVAYQWLRRATQLRKVDAATVAGYYGSDSAGTFVTCMGVLTTAGIVYEAYMPVMLAIMEIPGCLVALMLVARLRKKGMDVDGNAWDEPGYAGRAATTTAVASQHGTTGTRVRHVLLPLAEAVQTVSWSRDGGCGKRPRFAPF